MNEPLAFDAALATIRDCCRLLPAEAVALVDAAGRVLASPVEAPRPLPPFDNAGMDGFALRWTPDLAAGSELAVIAEQAAGDGIAGQAADACSIMTGARLPDGLDTVVPVEDCRVLSRDAEGRPTRIALAALPAAGQYVRRAGSDVAPGQQLLAAGIRLDEEALMVLRGIGLRNVLVRRRPRLALACTGRELVDADGAELAPGQIANTNGPYLERLLAEAGADVVERVTVTDSPEALAPVLARWLADGIELVVTTGAVSKGRYDFVPDVLASLGADVRFHSLRMRPGRPLLFATAGRGSLLFGLPGNPISSAIGARFFIDAAVRAMTGRPAETPVQLPLAADVRKKPGIRLVQKAALALSADGRLSVRVLAGQESFRTAPLLEARAWAMLPEADTHLQAGCLVAVHPLRPGATSCLDPSPA